ncbi:MAG: hypothetical protein KGL39_08105 [Patescibacteria group bacterium]|nr:hypothetical protein [Patescibacteria group bacterium]
MLPDSLGVLILIALLDASSFAARESAHVALARMEDKPIPQLMLYPARPCLVIDPF